MTCQETLLPEYARPRTANTNRPLVDGSLLHWLFPGADFQHGLRVLSDDKSCQEMLSAISDGSVADIYVEFPDIPETVVEESDFEDQLDEYANDSEDSEPIHIVPTCQSMVLNESKEETERQIQKMKAFYQSPTKIGKEVIQHHEVAKNYDDALRMMKHLTMMMMHLRMLKHHTMIMN